MGAAIYWRFWVLKRKISVRTVSHGDGAFEKGYALSDNHRVEIYALPDGTWRGEGVSVYDANRPGFEPSWPTQHPEARLVMRTDSVGDGAEHSASYTNAVRTMRALQETAMPMNLEATVDERFKSFGPMGTKGTLGSFMVGANTDLLDADGGVAVGLADIIGETLADGSSVTISGDFSFVSAAWLDTTNACNDTVEGRGLVQTEDEKVLDELTAVAPPTVAMYLCISVPTGDAAVAIPATDPYMVTTEYAAGTPMAGWPPNAGEHSLGRITRDGTTVHIPFLTTWADYNQRIVVSNRGANEADYWITFRPEDGVTATPGMYAMGTLDGNSTIMLRAMDVVTLEGRTRTAATFVAEAKSTQIDVATVIVNMMTGGTDTVNYESD